MFLLLLYFWHKQLGCKDAADREEQSVPDLQLHSNKKLSVKLPQPCSQKYIWDFRYLYFSYVFLLKIQTNVLNFYILVFFVDVLDISAGECKMCQAPKISPNTHKRSCSRTAFPPSPTLLRQKKLCLVLSNNCTILAQHCSNEKQFQ